MPRSSSPSLQHTVILYAEDDPDEAFLFEMAVKRAKLPVRISVVDDGQAAIEWLRGIGSFTDRIKHPLPAILVLDLKMPRKTGFQVLEWVRAHRDFKDLPVAVLSSSAETQDVQRALALGADRYIEKSVSSQEIVEWLKSMCS